MVFFLGLARRRVMERSSLLLLGLGGLAGLASLILTIGFPEGTRAAWIGWRLELPAVALFVAEHLLIVLTTHPRRTAWRRRWVGSVILLFLILEGLVLYAGGHGGLELGVRPRTLARIYLISLQFFVGAGLIRGLAELNRGLARVRLRPAAMAFLVFLALALTGTGLLSLPTMVPAGQSIPLVDALFTATSACCVTGLTVVDTSSGFSGLGQGVILLLIQIGGMGIMVLAAFLALFAGRAASFRERVLVRDVLNVPALGQVTRVVRFVVGATLVLELLGMLSIYAGLPSGIRGSARLFASAFHAVSAFCNAGFSTYADSLMGLRERPAVIVPMALLVILGGVGFPVLIDLWARTRLLAGGRGRRTRGPRLTPLGTQTRVVLSLSGLLLLGGWALFVGLEWSRSLAGLSTGGRILAGFFMSATPRTAGFTVTDSVLWGPGAVFVLMVLMLIGGGSGSTAGGVKVTTLGVLLAAVRSMARGRERTVLHAREIPERSVREAVVVFTVYLLALGLGTLALLAVEGRGFAETLFEAVSASGTVGLTLGLTPHLTALGKLVVVVLMLLGRVGPLTLALAVAGPRGSPAVRHPEGRIMIG